MQVIYTKRAKNAMLHVALYVEQNNTPGSGNRWFNRLDLFIHALAKAKADFGLCKNPTLAKYKYSCYTFNNWVIAFRIRNNRFEVCRFIYGKKLK